jgi:hypothetical protein
MLFAVIIVVIAAVGRGDISGSLACAGFVSENWPWKVRFLG